MTETLFYALTFLVAAVAVVPLFKHLGLGEVLGYLAAGVVIGPSVLGLVPGPEDVLQFAQLGIVLLLFVIGLELKPARLRAMRKPIFGFGSLQVFVTTVVLALLGLALGLSPVPALIVGFSLGLCSTPLVLQLLAEKRELRTLHGKHAFSLLLFQDLAAIPVLAVLPILVVGTLPGDDVTAILGELAIAAGAFVALIVGGRLLMKPLFRFAAGTRSREVFAATALTVVIGAGLLMDFAGLSTALGAFLAGVLLADSEYRHNIEADIEPFKGLLLGLFFMAVGMTTEIRLVLDAPVTVLLLVTGLLLAKGMSIVLASRLYGLPWPASVELGVVLSQGGEFAFVLLTAAVAVQLLPVELVALLVLVISISMATTPMLFSALARWVRPRFSPPAPVREFDPIEDDSPEVIIVGLGRFGQITGRILRALGIRYTVLEASAEQVDFVGRYGTKAYYGDASRVDLLTAAGAGRAKLVVLAIGDVAASMGVAEAVRRNFPHLAIYARARDRHHAHLLMRLGVPVIRRELLGSSMELTRDVLLALGFRASRADQVIAGFRAHDEKTLARQLAHMGNERELVQTTRDAAAELAELFESDVGLGTANPKDSRSATR
jgi:glutathione-regulated potassium-efflux system protein KefB